MSDRRHHDDDRHMTLRDHVGELSRRLLFIVSILLVASSLVYAYRAQIIPVLLQPLELAFGDQKLMYLNPAGGFNFIFFVSIYIGVAVATPFMIQQLYAFIRPMLPVAAQKLSAKLLLSSFLLLIAGVLFGYYIAVPGALKFLNEFAGEYVAAALTADSYLHFLIAYTLGLGLLFQIPFLLIIGNYIKPFTPGGLLRTERWAIILIVIASAIITPTPDPINLSIVALPIIIIYQIGVISVLVINANKGKKARKQAKVAAAQLKKQQKREKRQKKQPAQVSPVVHVPVVDAVVTPPATFRAAVVSIPVSSIASASESVPVTTLLSKQIEQPVEAVAVARTRSPAQASVRIPNRQHAQNFVQPPARQSAVHTRAQPSRRYADGVTFMIPE